MEYVVKQTAGVGLNLLARQLQKYATWSMSPSQLQGNGKLGKVRSVSDTRHSLASFGACCLTLFAEDY